MKWVFMLPSGPNLQWVSLIDSYTKDPNFLECLKKILSHLWWSEQALWLHSSLCTGHRCVSAFNAPTSLCQGVNATVIYVLLCPSVRAVWRIECSILLFKIFAQSLCNGHWKHLFETCKHCKLELWKLVIERKECTLSLTAVDKQWYE